MKTLIIAVMLFLAFPLASAQKAPQKFYCTVYIDVSAKDPLAGQITSHLSRNLRKLGDVVLVEKGQNADINVSIVAHSVKLKSDDDVLGYSISMVITKPLFIGLIHIMTHQKLTKQEWADIDYELTNQSELIYHGLKTGDSDNLERHCSELATTIDTEAIEPVRKMTQRNSSRD